MSDNIYTIDMVGDVLGVKETYVFNIPYYYSVIDGELFIMFGSIVRTDDGLTTVILSPEQEDTIRDDIALLLRSENNEDLD